MFFSLLPNGRPFSPDGRGLWGNLVRRLSAWVKYAETQNCLGPVYLRVLSSSEIWDRLRDTRYALQFLKYVYGGFPAGFMGRIE